MNYLSNALLLSLLVKPCIAAESPNNGKKSDKPNILYIITDDHALQAISAYGHPIAKLAPTPNIDRLAREGVLFTGNHCANSICGPSRATILTGKHSHANGLMRNDNTKFNGYQPTVANILQKEGYQTAVIGKWHLNTAPVGFDYYKILNDQGEYNNPDFITRDTTVQEKGYVTELITEFTKAWIEQRDTSRPFFMMMQHKAPHRNWIPAEKYYRLFEHVEFPVPATFFDNYQGREAAKVQEMNLALHAYEGHDLKMVDGVGSNQLLYDRWPQVFFGRMTDQERTNFLEAYRERNDDYYLTPRTDKEKAIWKLQRYLQDYLACVRSVDDSVGEMYTYLEENGLLENTIIIYTSDQGFYLGEHGWFDKRWMYEESFRMPLIIRHPDTQKQGTEVAALTQNIDFAPTFLDFAGVDIPDEMHGESLAPFIKGLETPENWRKSLYYHYYEYPGFHSVKPHNGVKMGHYKLIHFYKDNRWEMYDLQADSTEVRNIYGQAGYEKIQSELHQELRKLIDLYQVEPQFLK